MMAKSYFSIEFKLPMKPLRKWRCFRAKVVAKPDESFFDIYDIREIDSREHAPIDHFQIARKDDRWIDVNTGEEGLISALIGQAIDNRKHFGGTGTIMG